MVVSVAVYVLVGAYAIRRIEARRISDHAGPSVGWGRKGGFKSAKSDSSVEAVPRSRRDLHAIDHSAIAIFMCFSLVPRHSASMLSVAVSALRYRSDAEDSC